MKLSQAVLALCLLGTVLVTASAASDGKRSAESLQTTTSDQAQVSSYGHADVKRMCLKESRQYNCRSVGCPNILECVNSTTQACRNCVTHAIGQSDVLCCDHDEYDYEKPDGVSDAVTAPLLKVGTCDWDISIYKCIADDTNNTANWGGDCYDPILMENGAYKLGTAWGTCYLNADSEYCGHPFCDKMVLSFQGGVYAMNAYSKGQPTLPDFDIEADDWRGCFEVTDLNSTVLGNGRSSLRSSVLSRAIARTNLVQEVKAAIAASRLEAGQYRYHDDDDSSSSGYIWYNGVAVMFSGPVSVISMERNVEYSHGMLEYVPAWLSLGVSAAEPGATALVVNPYQYDIVLAKDSVDDYSYGSRDKYYRDSSYKEGY